MFGVKKRRPAQSLRLRERSLNAVDGIELFRSTHLEYARNYIAKQSQGGKRNPTDVGTGGTPFVPYLNKHRVEIRSAPDQVSIGTPTRLH